MTNPQRILKLNVNGAEHEVAAPPNAILLDVLREELHLTGTKRGCDMGTCGCCTVLIDGQNRLACLTLAAQASGRKVTTIEALGNAEHLHPLQAAFSEVGGSQCGFCTPGFIMSAKCLLDETPRPSSDEIRSAISGNLCRCTGYIKIVEAIQRAAAELHPSPAAEAPPVVAVRRPPR